MKDRMFKLLGHLFQYVGGKQLVMCCTGLLLKLKFRMN
ncbi:hypothetical protein S101520_02762 [Lactiplantibacillus plantarum subsp. plantarum]|nr:hypothetical protein S101520_02762 [Lactiplantibacillus plantarum subsp. plantarum]